MIDGSSSFYDIRGRDPHFPWQAWRGSGAGFNQGHGSISSDPAPIRTTPSDPQPTGSVFRSIVIMGVLHGNPP